MLAPLMTWLVTVGGWLVPGLGHLLLRRWGRAIAVFLCVGGIAVAGYKLGGQVFSIRTGNIYNILGHLAEAGTGVFYFLWPILEPAGADAARAAGDIGTRLLAIAGLLNFLCAIDAFDISRRVKQ